MARYAARRLLLFIPTLLGVTLLIFLLMRVMPGDAVDALIAENPFLTEKEAQFLRQSLGLDKPIHIQFIKWVGGLMKGDFGISFYQKRPVRDILAERFPRTLELALLSGILALVVGLVAGIISAVRQDTWADYTVRIITIGGLSLPTFFTGVILLFLLIKLFQWSPPLGFKPFFADPAANLSQIIWPALVQAYFVSSPIARMTRSQLLEVIRQDYIRMARAKGLAEHVIVIRHALKNALLPIITLTGMMVGRLLSGTVIVEAIFSVPGIGSGLVYAVFRRDYPVIQTFVFAIALVFSSINLIVDLLYGWVDPRIKYA